MKKENINILFLGGAKRVSLAEEFIRAGEELGHKVSIFSYELNDDCPIAFVGTVIEGKKWSDNLVIEHIEEIINKYDINILLPFVDPATVIAAMVNERQGSKVFIPVSNRNSCEVFFDKERSNRWCENNGIQIPSNDTTHFPLIAKPIKGSASKGILILKDQKELEDISCPEEYLIQAFIKGKEYTIDIYRSVRTKNIISLVPRERLETQGGESIKSITVKNDKIEIFAKSIISKTDLVGAITLQILEDDKKNIFFMEINPRFGGGVLNTIAAGADSPIYLLREFLNLEEKENEGWNENYMMIRRFKEYYKIKK